MRRVHQTIQSGTPQQSRNVCPAKARKFHVLAKVDEHQLLVSKPARNKLHHEETSFDHLSTAVFEYYLSPLFSLFVAPIKPWSSSQHVSAESIEGPLVQQGFVRSRARCWKSWEGGGGRRAIPCMETAPQRGDMSIQHYDKGKAPVSDHQRFASKMVLSLLSFRHTQLKACNVNIFGRDADSRRLAVRVVR